jgi:predicted DNA-binding transcriptional regulator AlpA
MKNLADEIITLTDASKLSGFSKTYISKMIDSGHVQKHIPGKFKLGGFFLGVIAFLQAQRKEATTKSPSHERVLKARAEAIEIANSFAVKDIVNVEESLLLIRTVIGQQSTELQGLGTRVTRDPKVRSAIDAAVDQILLRTADRMSKMIAELDGQTPTTEVDPDTEFFGS